MPDPPARKHEQGTPPPMLFRKIAAIIALGWCAGAIALGVAQGVLAAASSPPSSSSAAWWSGVREAVKANLSPDGTLSGAATQDTTVIASGTGVVKVDVPVSSKPSNRGLGKHLHHAPVVAHGRVTFDFPTGGTTSQDVSSNFAKSLPITVTPAYELNGHAMSASDLSKSSASGGVLLVKYQIANVTKQTTSVHFKGFRGRSETATVTEPIPYIAKVKFRLPKDTTGLDAPGATLIPLVSSLQVEWDVLLAPPLAAATHTVSYSIRVNGTPQVPKAQIQLQAIVVQPKSSAKASGGKSSGGKSSGKSSRGESSGKSSRHSSSKSSGRSRSSNSSKRAKQSKSSGRTKAAKPSTSTTGSATTETSTTGPSGPSGLAPTRPARPASPTAPNGLAPTEASVAIADADANAQAKLSQAQAAAHSELAGLSRSLGGLVSGQNTAVANTSAASDTRAGSVVVASQGALSGLSHQVATSQPHTNSAIAAAVGVAIAAVNGVDALASDLITRTVRHKARADALAAATTALKAQTSALVALVAQHVNEASAVEQAVTQSINDLGALPDHGAPAWTTLSNDLQAAQQKAQAALATANDLTLPVSRLASAAQQLQSDAAAVAAEAHDIASQASDIGAGLQTQVANALNQLRSQVGLLKGEAQSLGAKIDAAQAHVGDAASAAKANFDAALGQISAQITAKADAAKAAAHATAASAQQKLAAAESDYAQLLGVQQIGLANQLPGGNATGAVTQYGYYVINISGTSS